MAKIERRGGLWTTRVSVIDTDTGRRRQPRVSARTKDELRTLVAETIVKATKGELREPDRTPVGDWLDAWYATYRARPATRDKRGEAIRRIQADEIAGVMMSRLRTAHVQALVDRQSLVIGPDQLRSVLTALKMACRRPMRDGVLSPALFADLELPAAPRRPPAIWDREQVTVFLAAAAADDWHALWVLAVTLGIRRGELLALRWPDVDLAGATLTVARTLTKGPEGGVVVGDVAKSAAGHRPLRLPSSCLDALRQHRRRQLERRMAFGDAWDDADAVFDDGTGRHWASPQRVGERFHRLRTRAGLPSIRFHDLRHTAATHMLRSGIPVPTVSKILGHANPAVTMRVYAHVLAAMEDEAAAVIERMYSA